MEQAIDAMGDEFVSIEFDDGVAGQFVTVLSQADDTLRGMSGERRSAVSDALEGFSGVYATGFRDGSVVESQDRVGLARVLSDIREQVIAARTAAARERQRIETHDQWRERERSRERSRALSGFTIDMSFPEVEPDSRPIVSPEVSGTFVASSRPRAGTSAGGKTSADPAQLRGFVGRSGSMSTVMNGTLSAVKSSAQAFSGACSWTPMNVQGMLSGFAALITENRGEGVWISGIADAFEEAGTAVLANVELVFALSSGGTRQERFNDAVAALLESGLSPEQVFEQWEALIGLGLTDTTVKKLPIALKFGLANLDGAPSAARNISSVDALEYALDHPERGYALMGLEGSKLSHDEFLTQLTALQTAYADTQEKTKGMPGRPVVQLIGLGHHDGALTSAVSLGDLDTATNVGVNVSGMFSDVAGISNGIAGATELYLSAKNQNSAGDYAVVTWIGYKSPNFATVNQMARAEAGASELSRFLNGVAATGGDDPSRNLTVFAHSYGSTTAFEALQRTTAHVTALVTYGSAGVKRGVPITDLNAGRVYSAQAIGDGLAGPGQWLSGRVDPRTLEGVATIDAEGGNGENKVTQHDMYVRPGTTHVSAGGRYIHREFGYLSPGTGTMADFGSILATGEVRK